MKNEKGVTLIALVISIIIILILATVATYSGVDTYKNMRVQNFVAKMRVIQEKVDLICDDYKNWDRYGESGTSMNDYITEYLEMNQISDENNYPTFKKIVDEIDSYAETSWSSSDKVLINYFYFTPNDLENKLGLKNIDMTIIVNFTTRNVVSEEGVLTVDNLRRYRQYDLQGGQQLKTGTNPDVAINIESEIIENYGLSKKVQLTLTDNNGAITSSVREVYYGISDGAIDNVENWQDATKLSDYVYNETDKTITFTLDTSGKYFFKIVDSTNKYGTTQDNILEISLVNPPKLTDGMIPVKYNENEKKWVVCSTIDPEWYNYESQNSTTESGGTSIWANIMLSDGTYKTSLGNYRTDGSTVVEESDLGSMFVWIPRYEYKITYTNPSDKSKGGIIDVKFLYQTSSTSTDKLKTSGYLVHPVFQNGTENNFAKGEWDSELEGIWVAKFEAGYAKGNNNIEKVSTGLKYTKVYTSATKNYYTSQSSSYIVVGETEMYYPVFMGKTYSYNYISIGDCYTLSRALTNSGNPYGLSSAITDSHMMKNSDWGAVVYLAHSKYGRNGTEVTINNVNLNNTIDTIYGITGYAGASIDSSTNTTTINSLNNGTSSSYSWETTNGGFASTTGNIYGVYDMTGGGWEYVASYIQSGNTMLETYGDSFAKSTKSTKYATAYPAGGSTSSETDISRSYSGFSSIYGDAIYETSSKVGARYSWNGDVSDEDTTEYEPFFVRSARWSWGTQAGLFAFADHIGCGNLQYTFRSVLVVK